MNIVPIPIGIALVHTGIVLIPIGIMAILTEIVPVSIEIGVIPIGIASIQAANCALQTTTNSGKPLYYSE